MSKSSQGGFRPGFSVGGAMPKPIDANSRAGDPIVRGGNPYGGGYDPKKVGDKVNNGPRAPYPYDKPRG